MMTCVHLRNLYELCRKHDLKLAGSDLIHIICKECGEKEVCPSALLDEFTEEELEDADVRARERGGSD